MTPADLIARCEATSGHSVAVYDRPRAEVTDPHGQHIGTVNAGPNGVEAFRTHYSLAERSAARLPGPFATIGDGVAALIADHEAARKAQDSAGPRVLASRLGPEVRP